jgi:hypothetical protein
VPKGRAMRVRHYSLRSRLERMRQFWGVLSANRQECEQTSGKGCSTSVP